MMFRPRVRPTIHCVTEAVYEYNTRNISSRVFALLGREIFLRVFFGRIKIFETNLNW